MADHHGPSYLKVYFILLVLFIISVAGPELADVLFDSDQVIAKKVLVLSTAFGIAFVKAYYVIAYFMHLKFELKYVNYMLATTVMFMLLFFSGIAADIMNHKGRNWTNIAAAGEVERALAEIEARKLRTEPVYANLTPVPNQIKTWQKVGHQKYQVPVAAAMQSVVTMSRNNKNPGAVFYRHSGETPAEKGARKRMEAELKVEFDKLAGEKVETQTPSEALVSAGATYYKASQCAGCHSVDGSKLVGPSFKGLANRVFYGNIAEGDTTKLVVRRADSAYFNASINNPAEILVKGYGNQMPKISVSQKDRDALWAYIQSLSL